MNIPIVPKWSEVTIYDKLAALFVKLNAYENVKMN